MNMRNLNTRNFILDVSQIHLCIDAIDFYVDNILEMLENFQDMPDAEDEIIINLAHMMQLKKALSDETVEALYLRTDSNSGDFWIQTLEEVKTWFIRYAETNFDDECTEEELEEICERISIADADNLCEMLIPNEYWIEKIQT